jgi:hypothetical protein
MPEWSESELAVHLAAKGNAALATAFVVEAKHVCGMLRLLQDDMLTPLQQLFLEAATGALPQHRWKMVLAEKLRDTVSLQRRAPTRKFDELVEAVLLYVPENTHAVRVVS